MLEEMGRVWKNGKGAGKRPSQGEGAGRKPEDGKLHRMHQEQRGEDDRSEGLGDSTQGSGSSRRALYLGCATRSSAMLGSLAVMGDQAGALASWTCSGHGWAQPFGTRLLRHRVAE